jgi:hypothetical protein
MKFRQGRNGTSLDARRAIGGPSVVDFRNAHGAQFPVNAFGNRKAFRRTRRGWVNYVDPKDGAVIRPSFKVAQGQACFPREPA